MTPVLITPLPPTLRVPALQMQRVAHIERQHVARGRSIAEIDRVPADNARGVRNAILHDFPPSNSRSESLSISTLKLCERSTSSACRLTACAKSTARL